MPIEYKDTYSYVYCNDCEKKSHAKFHFIYHKCGHCRGYNTKVLGSNVGLPEDAVIAPEVIIPETAAAQSELTRLVSSTSIISSSSGSGSSSLDSEVYPSTGYWCHQCQVFIY